MDGDGSDADATPHMKDAHAICSRSSHLARCYRSARLGRKGSDTALYLINPQRLIHNHYHRCGCLFIYLFSVFFTYYYYAEEWNLQD
jgi:hypothetical protein